MPLPSRQHLHPIRRQLQPRPQRRRRVVRPLVVWQVAVDEAALAAAVVFLQVANRKAQPSIGTGSTARPRSSARPPKACFRLSLRKEEEPAMPLFPQLTARRHHQEAVAATSHRRAPQPQCLTERESRPEAQSVVHRTEKALLVVDNSNREAPKTRAGSQANKACLRPPRRRAGANWRLPPA